MMPPRTYEHAGRPVEAMRFVGNGPEIARWVGTPEAASGSGLSGSLVMGGHGVDLGDWVIRHGGAFAIVSQEVFAHRFREVRHADQQ
jgi:hypothetical protein